MDVGMDVGPQLIGGDDRLSVRGFFSLPFRRSFFLIEMFRTIFLYALPPAARRTDPLAPFAK